MPNSELLKEQSISTNPTASTAAGLAAEPGAVVGAGSLPNLTAMTTNVAGANDARFGALDFDIGPRSYWDELAVSLYFSEIALSSVSPLVSNVALPQLVTIWSKRKESLMSGAEHV
jgi:hypothetical protein